MKRFPKSHSGKYSFILIGICLFASAVQAKYSGGSGEPNNPYQIANITDFQQLSVTSTDWDKSFVLTANIDLTDQTFTQAPIAPDTSDSGGFQGISFSGVFDGSGHTISNLIISASGKDYVALFGNVSSGGQIKNLMLKNVNIQGRENIGGLAGSNSGTIARCCSEGAVCGTFRGVGGLAGFTSGTITSCYAISVIIGGSAGGLVGSGGGGLSRIENCYAMGTISTTGGAGGLAGAIESTTIERCYSTVKVMGLSNGGGLVGTSYGGRGTKNFWDIETSGRTTDFYATGKTTAEMKTLLTFTSAEWDFVGETANGTADVWRMCMDGVDYPRLAWEFSGHGDFVCPDGVRFEDFAVLAKAWLSSDGGAGWNGACDIAVPADGKIDNLDLMTFAQHWLEEAGE